MKCHLTVCFAPNACKCDLLSPLTLDHSNCWENNQMLLEPLGSLEDKTIASNNSILENSVIFDRYRNRGHDGTCPASVDLTWLLRSVNIHQGWVGL